MRLRRQNSRSEFLGLYPVPNNSSLKLFTSSKPAGHLITRENRPRNVHAIDDGRQQSLVELCPQLPFDIAENRLVSENCSRNAMVESAIDKPLLQSQKCILSGNISGSINTGSAFQSTAHVWHALPKNGVGRTRIAEQITKNVSDLPHFQEEEREGSGNRVAEIRIPIYHRVQDVQS